MESKENYFKLMEEKAMKEKIKKYYEELKINPQVQKKVEEILQNKKYNTTAITPAQIQLKKLEVDKLAMIRKAVIDFENNKIIEIHGENSIGKTLLAEAITLLLNNSGRDKLANIVSRETKMQLDFEINIENCPYLHSIVFDKGKWSRSVNGTVNLTGQTGILKYYKSIGIDDIFKEVIMISDRKSYLTEKDSALFKIFFMKFFDIACADKIKEDIGSSIKHNQSQIDSLYGEKSGLVSDDGPNVLNIKISSIDKELKKTEAIGKEYVDIVTKGSEGIVKLQNEIQKLDEKKLEQDELHDKVGMVIDYQSIFDRLAEKEKDLKKEEKVLEKVQVQTDKLAEEIKSSNLMVEMLNKNIGILD